MKMRSRMPEPYNVMSLTRDEYISIRMLSCFKALRREQPKKPQPDISWMRDLLDTVREAENTYDERQASKPVQTWCIECLEPQFETPSGLVCKNGHGGSPSLTLDEVEEQRRRN
jgi:hypothetical protein